MDRASETVDQARQAAGAAGTTVKVFAVLNPVGGHAEPEQVQKAIERHFAGSGRETEIYRTTGKESVPDVVRDALGRGAGLVLAAGGDGTVAGVVGGLAGSEVPLGIVPIGTENGLARALGIPRDVEEALALLAGEQRIVDLDAMRIGERLFMLVIGIGVSGSMMRDTGSEEKRRAGRLAYVWNLARQLAGLRRRRFTLTVDGERSSLLAAEILVFNTGRLSILRLEPDVELDDGYLGLCAVRARTLGDYLRLVWDLLRGRPESNPSLSCRSLERSVTVDADRPLLVQGDGEVIGRTPVEIQIVPRCVRAIAPAGTPARGLAAQEGD